MTGIGYHQTSGHIERGGLACAIGAQQSHYLTLMDIETHIVDHRALSIDLHQTFTAQLQTL